MESSRSVNDRKAMGAGRDRGGCVRRTQSGFENNRFKVLLARSHESCARDRGSARSFVSKHFSWTKKTLSNSSPPLPDYSLHLNRIRIFSFLLNRFFVTNGKW